MRTILPRRLSPRCRSPPHPRPRRRCARPHRGRSRRSSRARSRPTGRNVQAVSERGHRDATGATAPTTGRIRAADHPNRRRRRRHEHRRPGLRRPLERQASRTTWITRPGDGARVLGRAGRRQPDQRRGVPDGARRAGRGPVGLRRLQRPALPEAGGPPIATPGVAQSYQVTQSGGSPKPIAEAGLTSSPAQRSPGAQLSVTFPGDGWYRLKSDGARFIRSNRVYVCVGACGPAPADAQVRVPPRAGLLRPRRRGAA